MHRWVSLALPVDPFDVAELDSQLVAALEPTRFQDAAPPTSLHPLTKAMNAKTAAFSRLPGTFRHD
jgi:hypothetical protein